MSECERDGERERESKKTSKKEATYTGDTKLKKS